jgi:hypothetical protein
MGLGDDNGVCKEAFITAMRNRLEAEKEGLGANVEEPAVQQNLGALGQAVYTILTAHAETRSDASVDRDFWRWMERLDDWLQELRSWQLGVAKAFADWSPAEASARQLKASIAAVNAPGSLPQPPRSLRGKIR